MNAIYRDLLTLRDMIPYEVYKSVVAMFGVPICVLDVLIERYNEEIERFMQMCNDVESIYDLADMAIESEPGMSPKDYGIYLWERRCSKKSRVVEHGPILNGRRYAAYFRRAYVR